MQKSPKWLAAGLCIFALQGCSANWHSSFRLKPVDATKKAVVTVDAKQRAIIFGTKKSCSEASPDVFSVIAQSLAGGGSFSKSADPASVQAALNLAFSSAEQGSTIPRTQTINMLRELMFRTCERSLNGDIGPSELPIQAVRDQRLMVSILAIEQLTGAVTPKPVVIGASGSTTSSAGEAIIRLDDATKEVKASADATAKAQKDFNDKNGDDKTCDIIAKAVEEGTELTDDQKEKQEPCAGSATALADAKAREARARTHEADLQRLATGLGGSTATSVSSSAAGGIDQANTNSLSDITKAVKEIVTLNFTDGTEVMLFCLRTLTIVSDSEGISTSQANSLREMCVRYLEAYVGAEAGKKNLERVEAEKTMTRVSTTLFDSYWPTLEPQLANADTRKALVAKAATFMIAANKSKAQCFAGATSRDQAQTCFEGLTMTAQRNLAEGR